MGWQDKNRGCGSFTFRDRSVMDYVIGMAECFRKIEKEKTLKQTHCSMMNIMLRDGILKFQLDSK